MKSNILTSKFIENIGKKEIFFTKVKNYIVGLSTKIYIFQYIFGLFFVGNET